VKERKGERKRGKKEEGTLSRFQPPSSSLSPRWRKGKGERKRGKKRGNSFSFSTALPSLLEREGGRKREKNKSDLSRFQPASLPLSPR